LSQGIPPVPTPDISTGIVSLPGNATERSPWGGEIHRGYTQSWNFTIERKLPLDLVTSVAYVGTQTTHQMADLDINAGYPGSGTTGLPYNKPQFGNRTAQTWMWDGYLSSHYHSLQVAINKQFSRGLLIKGAYTWSKAIDYTDDDGWANVNWNTPDQFQRNRATSGFDRTHVFQIGWVYELPAGKGKRWANSGAASYIIGGWQVNGTMAAFTGRPFSITAPSSTVNAPQEGLLQTPDQVKSNVQYIGQPGAGGTWYDVTAFAAPSTGLPRWGNVGRNVLRGPGIWNTDVSLSKNIPIHEKMNLQFRAEFYNLPNTSHFGDTGGGTGMASTDVTNSNFLRVTSAYGERTIRFALRFAF
jgi:hypothetical protein